MKRIVSLTCACALTLALAACSSGTPASSGGGASSSGREDVSSSVGAGASGLEDSSSSVGGSSSEAGSAALSQPEEPQTAVLYIGMDGQFQEYPLEAEEITPEGLVAGIAELTGWNLDLAEEIASGKGGMTVTFAPTCALFVGPPEVQKDEFHVFDASQLDQTILDSVKKTLQNWAVVPGLGDPDSVDIYFCGPDGDLVLEGLGLTIPSTEPYQGFPS